MASEPCEARRELEDLIEYFPDALVDVDFATLAITNLNRTARRLLGYEREDLGPPVSLNIGHLLDTEALLRIEAHVRDVIVQHMRAGTYERRAAVDVFEVSVRRKDGSRFEAEFYGMMLLDAKGRPRGARCVIHDHTRRKAAEREREELLLQLREAMASVSVLSGLLPICAWCRRIGHEGEWKPLEQYIQSHGAHLSHGICPDCEQRLSGG